MEKTTLTLLCSFMLIALVSATSMEFSGVPHLRVRRDITNSTDGKEDISKLNLVEEDWDENYPVIFNILLWLGVGLLITTLAICTAIASMDPGRDSLIYRVTSAQRFKKDN